VRVIGVDAPDMLGVPAVVLIAKGHGKSLPA
jgi:hypothetical protein